jgi:VanZ family protein
MLIHRPAWNIGGAALVGLVVYLSLTPNPPELLSFSNFSNADKFEHALAYGTLTLWFCQIYTSARSRLIVSVLLVGLGVGLEYVQGWTGYRTFDLWDMAADAVGVLLGILFVYTPLGRLFYLIEGALRF